MSEQNNQRLRQLAESFTKEIAQIDQDSERAFINDLIEAVSTPPKKIPEPVFREIFLPYFTGERKPDPKNSAIAHWIGLVGSASEPADIVDVKGDVLFQVPPMYDSSVIDTRRNSKDAKNFATIFSVYEEEARVHPALGKKFLVEELSKKADATIPENMSDKSEYSWDPVLKYYKLIPDTQEQVKNAPQQTPGDDELDFGDE